MTRIISRLLNNAARATSHLGDRKTIIVSTVCTVGVVVYYGWAIIKRKFNVFVRDGITYIVESTNKCKNIDLDRQRSSFRELICPQIKPRNPSHTHPESAAWRSAACFMADFYARKIGKNLFCYQGSRSDMRHGFDYSRQHFWAKDVIVSASAKTITSRHVVLMVDTDYYVDMPKFLCDHNNVVIIYAFQPNKVAKAEGEYVFCFDEQNQVIYRVSGGAEYKHQVWNYSKDVIMVTDLITVKAYILERRLMNDDHELIALIPIGHWDWAASIIARYSLQAEGLNYLSVARGNYAVLDVHKQDGMYRSLAKLNTHNCATVNKATLDALMSVSTTSTQKINNASVMSWIDDRHESSIVVEYLRDQLSIDPDHVYPANAGIRNYQLVDKFSEYEQEAKNLMVSYMSPVYPNTFVPDKTLGNEKAAVKGRVIEPQAEAESLVKPTKFLYTIISEFVDLLVPGIVKTSGHPVDYDTVMDRQDRPTQRAILEQAEANCLPEEPVCSTFMKAEPYQKPSDPRIITTYNGNVKRDYSSYIYALTDYIQQFEWYSFGKSPQMIATLVAEICMLGTTGVSCADAVRMDGHVSAIVRDLERMVLLAFFSEEHHNEVSELHEMQYNCKAYTSMGFKYYITTQRGSGSPETALFNSILTKFIDYLARRLEKVSPRDSYTALGQFAGDDSIAANIAPESIIKAGAMVGQKIENVHFEFGSAGVNYLSRFYTTEVWYGNTVSTCDLPRALGKLHVSVNMPVEPLVKLQQKLSGLSRTDRNTPIITQIITAAERLGMRMLGTDLDKNLAGWWAQYETDVNWPNEPCNDEAKLLHDFFPNISIDTTPLYDYLDRAIDITQLLTMPSIARLEEIKPTVKKTVVITDEIFEPPVEIEEKYSEANDKSDKNEICWRYTKGECNAKNCKYEHVKICRQFQAGKCTYGKKCKFSHIKQ